VRYALRTFFGFTLMVTAWVVLGYSIYQLLQVGTCASGGPYEIARECPGGIERLILAIFGGIVAILAGAGIYATRGKAPGSDDPPRNELLVVWVWTGIFWSLGIGSLLGVWGPEANPGPGGKEGGLIVGFLFLPMGAGGLLALGRGRIRRKAIGDPAAAGAPVETSLPGGVRLAKAYATKMPGLDPLARLERLQALREKGAISEAEFEQMKRDLLAEQ
jgi:Short C-terminal domain